ncbi:hypothetical protein FHS89_002561 [Rubricella aquisinus]|uniref:Gene transfer agent protein n=1 Tax=Rubricella aquisinus TaxID=2028108 RepID=A0A840WZF5_9RHOB|nr:hypothetical protein [Rubricella aquisinus]MBB5516530.1 hypothetical protein [Rubricella aquisinus]
MSDLGQRRASGGSRYLYEPFSAASARVDTLEAIVEERWVALERRLAGLEQILDRMERRMWTALYGIATFLIVEGVFLILQQTN